MNRAELVMRRKNVRAFIDADPIQLNLKRKTDAIRNERTGGMIAGTPEDIPEQRARIVLNKRRYTAGIVNSEAGDIPHTDYLLLGNSGLNLEVNDEFVWMGEGYRVTGIYKARTESVLASIDILGGHNAN